jgi:hypothetical protein
MRALRVVGRALVAVGVLAALIGENAAPAKAAMQTTTVQRHFPAHPQPRTPAKSKPHGAPGCFHGVGRFGGGCR